MSGYVVPNAADNSGMDDEVANYLKFRWMRLGEAGAVFCRPWFDLDYTSAKNRLDPEGRLGNLRNKDVLCLAGGGGQQSVAFALLGAKVTVLDLDAGQLDRDTEAARHHGLRVRTEQGDMRDLTRFEDGSFDIVWHPYSINFVPEFEKVIVGVARVLRRGGLYTVMLANPFSSGTGTDDWNGDGYLLQKPYVDGAAYAFTDENWVQQASSDVPAPREFRHTLGKVVRVLADAGFVLFRIDEAISREDHAAPGTWNHLKSVIPPWMTLWARLDAGLEDRDPLKVRHSGERFE
jgi:ubiquinone/menaquinone biosynthesis C-methylase UbiE